MRRPAPARAGASALVAYVVLAPCAYLIARSLDVDPLTGPGAAVPAVAGAVLAIPLLVIGLVRPGPRIAGAAAGAFGAWIAFVLTASLVGTPYGYGGLQGDVVRLTAMATRYMSSWGSTDQFVSGLPAEYPPLMPWLTGRLADALGTPAWSLVGDVEVVFLSLGVVLAFMLWQRLVHPAVALALVALNVASGFVDPRKGYEIVALWVFVPWVLAALADRPRGKGGMHWLPAGLVGGLIVLTYQGYFLFSAPGLLALVAITWWRSAHRRAYLVHCLAVAATAAVVASWFLVPYAWTALTQGSQRIYDYYVSQDGLVHDPLGLSVFLDSGLTAAVNAVGLAGLVVLRRRSWWALPLGAVLLGALAYRLIYLVVFVYSGHTGLLHYTTRLFEAVLTAAAVLTVTDLAAAVRRHGWISLEGWQAPSRSLAVVAMALLLLGAGRVASGVWMPVLQTDQPDCSRSFALCAHAEPLPSGKLPRYSTAAVHIKAVPVAEVGRVLASRLGRDARPVTVAYDERFLAVLPYPGWTSIVGGASNSLQRYPDRIAYLGTLSRSASPATLADGLRSTPWGPIDVLVLRRHGDQLSLGATGVSFPVRAFDSSRFEVVGGLPASTVVVIRR